MGRFRNEVANIVKLREQMYDSVFQHEQINAVVVKTEKDVAELKGKFGNMTLNHSRQIGDLDK